ncbi:MAG: YIP1 family protein [Caulobacter sp.]|nr:YIP1 family protein [Caulobacter sp.]
MTVIEPGASSSDLVGRVKRLLLSPSSEWDRIDTEPATIKGLYVGYVCILAAIPPLASLIGGQVFGHGAFGVSFRPNIVSAIVGAIVQYGLTLVSVFLLSLIIDALATSFDATKDRLQAFKVAAYTGTAGWVFGVLAVFPPLAIIAGLAGLYGLYLLYLGLPKLMKAPKEKAVGYTVVTILCAIVLFIVVGAITGAIAGAALLGAGAGANIASAGKMSGTMSVNGTNIDLDKVQAASKQLEAAAASAQSGKASPAVSSDVLKGLLPGDVAGFSRTGVETNSGGAGGVSMATASGDYARGDRQFTLSITDLGGMSGLAAMAGAVDAQSSRETGSGYEKMGKVDGRMTTEEWDRDAKSGRYSVVVGNRFTVEAHGAADNVEALKQAVASVDFGRLESLAR